MDRTTVAAARREEAIGKEVCLQGWVRTRRDSKGGFSFLELNDGSCFGNVQIVADGESAQLRKRDQEADHRLLASPSRARCSSRPPRARPPKCKAPRSPSIGWADPETYPIQKKGATFEFLRTVAHLRPRTNTFGAISPAAQLRVPSRSTSSSRNRAFSTSTRRSSPPAIAKGPAKCSG